MSNHFFRVTSEGGFLGRWFWGNTGGTGCDGWGGNHWITDKVLKDFDSAWAGSIPILRYLTLPTRQEGFDGSDS
jgi:hypothetical protein